MGELLATSPSSRHGTDDDISPLRLNSAPTASQAESACVAKLYRFAIRVPWVDRMIDALGPELCKTDLRSAMFMGNQNKWTKGLIIQVSCCLAMYLIVYV
jgi:hypothetical protein